VSLSPHELVQHHVDRGAEDYDRRVELARYTEIARDAFVCRNCLGHAPGCASCDWTGSEAVRGFVVGWSHEHARFLPRLYTTTRTGRKTWSTYRCPACGFDYDRLFPALEDRIARHDCSGAARPPVVIITAERRDDG
jgi:hypothetical protein